MALYGLHWEMRAPLPARAGFPVSSKVCQVPGVGQIKGVANPPNDSFIPRYPPLMDGLCPQSVYLRGIRVRLAGPWRIPQRRIPSGRFRAVLLSRMVAR